MNKSNTIRVIALGLIVFMILSAFGCIKIDVIDRENALYSREYINTLKEGNSFGKGALEAHLVMLDYIYNNEEISELYGDDFEVDENGVIGTSETDHFLLKSIIKGTSEFRFLIIDDVWVVNAEIEYFGKWEVTDCYLSDEEWVE